MNTLQHYNVKITPNKMLYFRKTNLIKSFTE